MAFSYCFVLILASKIVPTNNSKPPFKTKLISPYITLKAKNIIQAALKIDSIAVFCGGKKRSKTRIIIPKIKVTKTTPGILRL